MADIKALKSYLVSLGFQVNQTQLTQFNNAIKDTARLLETTLGPEIGMFVKLGAAAIGTLVGIGTAAVATANKIAMRDQDFRLWGQTMFMDVQHARSLKIATEALGASIEQIAFDPELHKRFIELQALQKTLTGQLGPNFEDNMRRIRDVRFEFSKMRVEGEYFFMNVVSKIIDALGGEKFLQRLREFNDYVVAHIPEWSSMFATHIVPIIKLLWGFIELAMKFYGVVMGGVAGAGAGAAIGGTIGMFTGGPLGALAGAGTGAAIGGGIGAIGGGLAQLLHSSGGGDAGTGAVSSASIQNTDNIRALAQQVGANLGINPSLIYGQWEHETGNFTNRGARQLNNLAGIRLPGSTEYRAFSSLGDFGNYYTNLIRRRYPEAMGAQNAGQFAGALKRHGYFEDTLANYTRGVQRGAGMYGGGVTIGTINIMQPNATPEQIASHVSNRIQQEQQKQAGYNIAELRPAY